MIRDTVGALIIEPCHLGAGLAAGDDAFGDFAALDRVEFLAPAANAAFSARRGQTGRRPFPHHRTLKLGEASDHLHHHATRWRRSINRLGD